MAKTAKEQLGVDLPEQPEPDPSPYEQPTAEEPPETEERPEWLPEKYKSPEDLASAHKSLENELRERGEREREYTERLAMYEEELAQLAQQQQRQQPQQADHLSAYVAEMEVARENGDTRREAELQAWLARYNVDQALQGYQQQSTAEQAPFMEQQHQLMAKAAQDELRSRYDDWDEMKERVGQMLDEDPDLLTSQAASSYDGIVRSLDRAYKLAQRDDLASQLEEIRKTGMSAEDIGRARKLQAQTLPGSSGRPGEPSEADKQLAEMQQALHGSSWEHQPR